MLSGEQEKVKPTGAAFVSNKHVYFISALHMRPFRELYMYLCVAQQGGGGRWSTPPGHHLARRLPRIRHEKCVREKFLLSLFMIGISGALMCRCLSNIFVRFLFFLSHFIFTFFSPSNYPTRRSYVAAPEPLALLLPLTCCRHHYK